MLTYLVNALAILFAYHCIASWLVVGAYVRDVSSGRSRAVNMLLFAAAPVSVWVLLYTDVKPVMAERAAERAPRGESAQPAEAEMEEVARG